MKRYEIKQVDDVTLGVYDTLDKNKLIYETYFYINAINFMHQKEAEWEEKKQTSLF